MSIHSHLPYDPSTSHARVPTGGIHLITSIDSAREAQFTASFFGSTKSLHGGVATTSPATTTHNDSNQQYSITAVTTSAGAIAERYAYTAYGELKILDGSGSVLSSSSISNRYSYTGREWDATAGLYHFRARGMSPKSGRFLGRDPIKYLGGVNLFSFMRTRLLDSADPLGLKNADHHLFPKAPSIRPRIESLCKGFNVEDWTVPVDAGPNGHGNVGTEHWQWHHRCGKYIDKANEILGKSRNCCDFLTDMIELINNTNQCVVRL